MAFLSLFEFMFTNLTRNVSANALIYLKGLLLCRRRNCQVMAEELQESNQQRLHHFITGSKWNFSKLMDTVTIAFSNRLQQLDLDDDTCLIVDETGNPKKGKLSAGVQRQYCGQLGKIDNCQVGVFGALCGGSLVNLVQARLKTKEGDQTKIDQAREIIDHVIDTLKVKVKWVCFDAFYGRDGLLLAHLISKRIWFIADVPDNLLVCLEPFQMRVPVKAKGVRGRKFENARPNKPFISLRDYACSLDARQWKYLQIRYKGNGKKLNAWFHSKDVYIENAMTGKRQLVQLLIRQDGDGTIKYSYCYCPGATLQQLAYRQSKRYFIEKSLREGKKELGLNEYQTRSEESYHKHMAMVMLGQLFLNEEKIYHYQKSEIWLTTQDVIHSIRSILHSVLRNIEILLNNILAKQPPDKRLMKKLLYIRI